MPYSYVQYPGNGSTTSFTVTFPYLLRAHVKLYYGLSLQSGGYTQLLVDGVNYNWVNSTTVLLTAAPASGVTLTIRRETPTDNRLVDWSDGSALIADNLDTADLQNFYSVQEQRDYVDALSINPNTNVTDSSITANKLSSDAVTLAKLVDGVLAAGAAGLAKMADGFLAATTAGRAKMSDGYVTTDKLSDSAVTSAKIADGTIATGDIASGAVTPDKVAAGSIFNIIVSQASQVPQNAKSAAYTLVASDAGRHISITAGGITVPANILSVGDVVSVFNNSSSSQTITQGASVTLRQAGTTATGNRILAQYGIATILCVAANTFVISGAGLT